MPFTLRYHPAVRDVDLPLIDRKSKDSIRKAIEELADRTSVRAVFAKVPERLMEAPRR